MAHFTDEQWNISLQFHSANTDHLPLTVFALAQHLLRRERGFKRGKGRIFYCLYVCMYVCMSVCLSVRGVSITVFALAHGTFYSNFTQIVLK